MATPAVEQQPSGLGIPIQDSPASSFPSAGPSGAAPSASGAEPRSPGAASFTEGDLELMDDQHNLSSRMSSARKSISHTRNRSSSSASGFDLSPFRLLLDKLEKEDAATQEGGRKDVKHALGMLLHHVDAQTSRLHTALAKQLETETKLRIAESNLAMAEANTEMIEEALRRGGEFSRAIEAQTIGRRLPPSPNPAAQSPAPAAAEAAPRSSNDLSSWFNGLTSSSKPPPVPSSSSNIKPLARANTISHKPAASTSSTSSARPIAIRQPTNPWESNRPAERPSSGIWESLGPLTPGGTNPLAGFNFDMLSTAVSSIPNSVSNLSSSFNSRPPSPTHGSSTPRRPGMPSRPSTQGGGAPGGGTSSIQISYAEWMSLRSSLNQEKSQTKLLNERLEGLQEAKRLLEHELESLSQALFEEANKMVSDERKLRLEREEEAKEARGERDVLRQTVKLVEADCESLRRALEFAGVRPASSATLGAPFALAQHQAADRSRSTSPFGARGVKPSPLTLPLPESPQSGIIEDDRRIPIRSASPRVNPSPTFQPPSSSSASSPSGLSASRPAFRPDEDVSPTSTPLPESTVSSPYTALPTRPPPFARGESNDSDASAYSEASEADRTAAI